VLADNTRKSSSKLAAGGLVGEMFGCEVVNCFAKGSVTAQSAGDESGFAGGILGNVWDSSLSNSVALGTSVIVKIDVVLLIRVAARVYGIVGTGTSADNYAQENMKIGSGEGYWVMPDEETVETTDLNYGINKRNGGNASSSNLGDKEFWKGLGFTDAATTGGFWDFSSITVGYPRLANVGGQ